MKTLERNPGRTFAARSRDVDVCLFVEGTYPYVTGGVSAWLQNLITNLPEFTFAIFHLASKPEPGRSFKYRLPANVVSFQELFLSNPRSLQGSAHSTLPAAEWEALKKFHESLGDQKVEDAVAMLPEYFGARAGGRAASEYIYSEEAWKSLMERYYAHSPSVPFLNYFWTFRSTHLPLFTLNEATFPVAKLYHAVSTGYAGYAAALAKLQHGSPMLITEHGIYTRERDMEIALSAGMDEPPPHRYHLNPQAGFIKTWWMDMFRFISRFTYELADSIISITGTNQQYQLRDGADPAKLKLISNGIDIERFQNLNVERRAESEGFTVGFVGRVVSIKDVKCFIQAIKIASATIPGFVTFIIGPTDEDEEYLSECRQLTELLGLADMVNFTGRANVFEYYARIDILVLTSLSEGQPLVILEANCAGIPVVATDVGACRDLLEGITDEDKALGPSGLLTLPASPDQTAAAIIQLWKDRSLRQQMANAGRKRVAKFYREDAMYAAYRDIYGMYSAVKQAQVKV